MIAIVDRQEAEVVVHKTGCDVQVMKPVSGAPPDLPPIQVCVLGEFHFDLVIEGQVASPLEVLEALPSAKSKARPKAKGKAKAKAKGKAKPQAYAASAFPGWQNNRNTYKLVCTEERFEEGEKDRFFRARHVKFR